MAAGSRLSQGCSHRRQPAPRHLAHPTKTGRQLLPLRQPLPDLDPFSQQPVRAGHRLAPWFPVLPSAQHAPIQCIPNRCAQFAALQFSAPRP